ncbi:hypothetical protein [Fusibacter sp. 3D3]|uniref:hypothetical protein n=1 Tax=Fusibacter sp. 3D3 TaxID=1048380 RepID=UPI000853ADD6|nr:hypothetical protein [Fusibacter sp. 3D3]GAU76008.1 hypothetical protein F3D3_0604 [Fusibacter sp. 3D3]
MSVLFVPLAVEAYVTNDENMKAKEIASIAPNYTHLKNKTHLGGQLDPKPFESLNPLNVGVHLHFILPDALTHAMTQADGELSYQRIPNRWLVTRLWVGDKIESKSWVVESDYLGLDNTYSVTVPYLTDEETPYRFLGRAYKTDETPSEGKTYLGELTAVGPGDSTFAAYYPNCSSVFGFHDNLEDMPSGDLTYFVMGYFSDEKEDPLYQLTAEAYNAYLENNAWSVAGEGGQAERMICQGMVYTVPWRGPHYDYPSNTPTGVINAAVGNTSVEALSAMIADKMGAVKKDRALLYGPENQEERQVLERFLALLQYDLLNYLEGIDGVAEVEDHLHEEAFNPTYGGIVWQIRMKETTHNQNIFKVMGEIEKGTGKQLTLLNEAQANYDQLLGNLNSKRQNLFSAWQRYVDLMDNPPAPWVTPNPSEKEIVAQINRLLESIQTVLEDTVKAEQSVQTAKEKLEGLIVALKSEILLEAVKRESFYEGKPPALLLGGAGISRQYAFGEDGRFTASGTLMCRTTLVDALEGTKTSLDEAQILSYCHIPEQLPKQYSDLFCEAVCFSPACVAWIDQKVADPDLKPKGTMPSPIAYSEWIQPWISLFLEWQISWLPTRTAIDPDNSLEGWTFNNMDYEYTKEPVTEEYSYEGRTILTPHSTKLLEYALEKNMERYKADEKLYEALKKALEKTRQLAVLSQQLSGVWTQLLSLDETLQIPIMSENEYKELAEQVIQGMGGRLPNTVVPNAPFFPIRAGFLQVDKVNIVNTFGIRQQVNSTLKETIFSEELYAKASTGQLSPRFAQGARLNFDWISFKEASVVSCLDPETSPVCSYLYPDFLNHALAVYDADGSFKGRMNLVYRDNSPEVRWVSAPGEPSDIDAVTFISDHTKAFLRALLHYNDNKDPAFYGLMALIEKRIDMTCTYNNDQDFFTGWSRPLALARARISLDLPGEPEYSQKSDDFGRQITYGYEQVKIPVYIGDISRSLDGSVGFFPDLLDLSHQYDKMHCIYNTEKMSIETQYLSYDSPICVSAADRAGIEFTLLMEATADVSFRTGMLPAFKQSIPAEHVEPVLANLDFSFEVNPIVSNADQIKLPLFSKDVTEWSWYWTKDNVYVNAGSVTEPKNVFDKTNPIYFEGFLKRKERKK